jgi:hypothetical protein
MEQTDAVVKTGVHKKLVDGKSIHIEIDPFNPYKSALEDFKNDAFDFIVAGDEKSKSVKYINEKKALMTKLFAENSDDGEKLFQHYQGRLSHAFDENHIRKGKRNFNYAYASSRQHFLFRQTVSSFNRNLDFAIQNKAASSIVNNAGMKV